METDSLYSFVMSNEMLERDNAASGEEYFISVAAFRASYSKWCKAGTLKMVNMADANNLANTLSRANLTIRTATKRIGNTECDGQWIFGVRPRGTTILELEDMSRGTQYNSGNPSFNR